MSEPMQFPTSRIFTGRKGKVIDDQGLPIQQATEFEAHITLQHGDVKTIGTAWTGSKLEGMAGEGTLKVYKISNDLNRKIAEALARGEEYITQFIGEMGDDSENVEQVLLENVKFTNQLTLVKSAAQATTDLDLTFKFVGYRYL